MLQSVARDDVQERVTGCPAGTELWSATKLLIAGIIAVAVVDAGAIFWTQLCWQLLADCNIWEPAGQRIAIIVHAIGPVGVGVGLVFPPHVLFHNACVL